MLRTVISVGIKLEKTKFPIAIEIAPRSWNGIKKKIKEIVSNHEITFLILTPTSLIYDKVPKEIAPPIGNDPINHFITVLETWSKSLPQFNIKKVRLRPYSAEVTLEFKLLKLKEDEA